MANPNDGYFANITENLDSNEIYSVSSFRGLDKMFPATGNDRRGWVPKNLWINKEGIYSISSRNLMSDVLELIEKYTKQELSSLVITDATANVGGSVITFALHCKMINAVEIDKKTAEILTHNVACYNLQKFVNIKQTDYLQIMNDLQQDVVFIDPPWGGPDYKNATKLHLTLSGKDLQEIIQMYKIAPKLIIIKVPVNFDFEGFAIDHWKMSIHPTNKAKLIALT
jgi:hypothetical protein